MGRTRGVWTVTIGVAAIVVLLGACGSSGSDTSLDSVSPSRAGSSAATVDRPRPGSTWQWQLSGEIDTGHDADVYDVDLFDVSAATIAELHVAGRFVLCYFSAGTLEDWRPDADEFPAETIGRPMDDWPGERWLDVRSPAVLSVHEDRLDLAVRRGCDGVEPDNVTGYDDDTGFDLDREDQLAFNRALAEAAHARGLAVASKNGPELVGDLVGWFDLAVTEQCHEFDECESYTPFVEQGKLVLNAEYADEWVDDEAARRDMCAESARLGIVTLVLPLELDGSFRLSC